MFHYTHLIEFIARNIYRHFFYTFLTKKKKSAREISSRTDPTFLYASFLAPERSVYIHDPLDTFISNFIQSRYDRCIRFWSLSLKC